MAGQRQIATFAGGCFWCMQPPFEATRGVISTRVGYTGGHTPDPSYEAVCTGTTGHLEAIEVIYDPGIIRYEALLEIFWHNIDPTQEDGQFADRGPQYQTAILYHDETQRQAAEASKAQLATSGRFDRPIATRILPAGVFHTAEDGHQHYAENHPVHYTLYKHGSGRADFLEQAWGDRDP